MFEYLEPHCPKGRRLLRILLVSASPLVLTFGLGHAAKAQDTDVPDGQSRAEELLDPSEAPGAGIDQTSAPSGFRPIAGEAAYSAAEERLLRQARFWEARYDQEGAIEALEKVLKINPNNHLAVYHLGRLQAQAGNVDGARAQVRRLQNVRADERYVSELQTTIRLYENQGQVLAEARNLAASGRIPDAVRRYQEIFRGQVPGGALGVEYYHTLAGEGGNWNEAVTGLQQELQRDPTNRGAEYALAEVLTYREATRRDGLRRLRRFASDATYAERAGKAYRNGLLWLNATLEDKSLYDQYLKTFPDDAQMREKYANLISPPLIASASETVNRAYEHLYADELELAESRVRDALREDPNDANALVALGLIRLRQDRFPEAEEAFNRAFTIDSAVRPQVEQSYVAARFWRRYHDALKAREAGDLDQAEKLLGDIRNANIDGADWAKVALADLYMQMKRRQDAERIYRDVLGRDPSNAAALTGLVSLLQETGRVREAVELGRKLPAAERQRLGFAQLEAQLMRARADAALKRGEVRTARRELEAAVRRVPNDPWLRLDLATLLVETGRRGAADAQMRVLENRRNKSNEDKQAIAVYRSRVEDWGAVVSTIESLPSSARTRGMRRLLSDARFFKTIEDAKVEARRNPESARASLVQLEADHAGNPDRLVLIADAYIAADGEGQAVSIARRVLDGDKKLSVSSLLRLAEILSDAGDTDDANKILADLRARKDLPGDFNNRLSSMRRKNKLAEARVLMNSGQLDEAYEVLKPLLEGEELDAEILRLAGELHDRGGFTRQAFALYSQAVELDPSDIDGISGAVGTALKLKDLKAASRFLDDGLSRMPNEPLLFLLAAEVAQAAGDKVATIEALEAARRLKQEKDDGLGSGLTLHGSRREISYEPAFDDGSVRFEEARAETHAEPQFQYPANTWLGAMERRLARAGWAPEAMTPISANMPSMSDADAAPAVHNGAVSGAGAVGLRTISADEPQMDLAASDTGGQHNGIDPQDILLAQSGPSDADRVRRRLRVLTGEEEDPEEVRKRNERRREREEGVRRFLRPTPQRTRDTSSASAFDLFTAPIDPLDQRIADLRWEVDPIASQDFEIRRRSGDEGLSQLFELRTVIRGEFNLFKGRAFLEAAPTFVSAGGSLSGVNKRRQLGAVSTLAEAQIRALDIDDQEDTGVAVSAGWEKGAFSADIGVTPIGFEVVNVVGGLRYLFDLSNDWFLRAELERRPVLDSVLSYAGSVDPVTGQTFGGVTRSGGNVNIVRDFGRGGIYFGGGYSIYDGDQINQNDYYEVGAGFYYKPIIERDRELQVGLNTTYFSFDENQNLFTLGNGGYFSPQQFVSISVPAHYRVQKGRLRYNLDGAIGVQYFAKEEQPFFPNDPALQNQAEAQATGAQLVVDPEDDTIQLSYRLGGDVFYRVTENFEVGARASIDDTADYTEAKGGFTLRYRFGPNSGN